MLRIVFIAGDWARAHMYPFFLELLRQNCIENRSSKPGFVENLPFKPPNIVPYINRGNIIENYRGFQQSRKS